MNNWIELYQNYSYERNKYEPIPLFGAAGRGHKEIVELLIQSNADVNAKANLSLSLDSSSADKKLKAVTP